MNQTQLGSIIGVTMQAISGYENGNSPSYESFISISNYFNVSLDDLVRKDLSTKNGVSIKEESKPIIEAQKETIEAYKKLIDALERQLNEKEL